MSIPHIWSTIRQPAMYLDLPTFLMENRTIFIGPELTSEMASQVSMQLIALAREREPITLYINCHGGSVPAGLAIMDIVQSVDQTTPIHTYCFGECVGVALAILVSGRKGERAAFPSARFTLYQDWYGVESLWGAQSQDRGERDRLLRVLRDVLKSRTNLGGMGDGAFQNAFTDLRFFSAEDAQNLEIIDRIDGTGLLTPSNEPPPSWPEAKEVA